jgi:deoxyribose-phosphate aldolase
MNIYKKLNEYLESKEKSENYKLIDYTKISDNLSNDNIKEFCKDVENNGFYAITILPQYVATAHSFSKSEFKVSAIIDFPKGTSDTKHKISEIDKSLVNGADEIDVVVNYALIKEEDSHEKLENEIRELTEFCHREGAIIKLTIEIGALTYQEIEKICRMCVDNNVDFITTSTGKLSNDDSFETKLEKVKYMRKILPEETNIKFSGGIRTQEQIKELKSFVDRIATSIIIS